MSEMVLWLAGMAVVSVALLWGMRREHARLDREARMRALLRPMADDWGQLKVQIGERLLPAIQSMAPAALAAVVAMKRLQDALTKAGDA